MAILFSSLAFFGNILVENAIKEFMIQSVMFGCFGFGMFAYYAMIYYQTGKIKVQNDMWVWIKNCGFAMGAIWMVFLTVKDQNERDSSVSYTTALIGIFGNLYPILYVKKFFFFVL